jgi:transcriptional regulator with XRE-family HTH domain
MSEKKMVPQENETIGKRLSRFRKNAGFTQNELAKKLGISRSALAEYERGRLKLYDALIIKLVDIFKKSSDELLGIKRNAKAHEEELSLRFVKRLKAIAQLPNAQQKLLLRNIDLNLSGIEKELMAEKKVS